jgi:transposase
VGDACAHDPPAKRGGRPRDVNVREVLNAIFYVLSTGCQWKALPKDLPPKSTAHYYFMLWDWDGTLKRIHYALYVVAREQAGREASPTAANAEYASLYAAAVARRQADQIYNLSLTRTATVILGRDTRRVIGVGRVLLADKALDDCKFTSVSPCESRRGGGCNQPIRYRDHEPRRHARQSFIHRSY